MKSQFKFVFLIILPNYEIFNSDKLPYNCRTEIIIPLGYVKSGISFTPTPPFLGQSVIKSLPFSDTPRCHSTL